MDMPPSRYRVVERGRRLVVLDTQRGDMPVSGLEPEQQARIEALKARLDSAPPPSPPRPPAEPRRPAAPAASEADAQILTTQPWFDDRAPRRVRIDSNALSQLTVLLAVLLPLAIYLVFTFGAFAVFFAAVLLINPQLRRGIRRTTTRWLDRRDQVTGSDNRG